MQNVRTSNFEAIALGSCELSVAFDAVGELQEMHDQLAT
jgi:hypothetical protein